MKLSTHPRVCDLLAQRDQTATQLDEIKNMQPETLLHIRIGHCAPMLNVHDPELISRMEVVLQAEMQRITAGLQELGVVLDEPPNVPRRL
jgi:hypothetical protein